MAVILLECKEDKEKQAIFPSKEASSPILENTASYINGTILTEM